MQLSDSNAAVLRQFVVNNSAVRRDLERNNNAREMLFSLNLCYAYLGDFFRHLERLVNLSPQRETYATESFEHTRNAVESIMKAQQFLKFPAYHQEESLKPYLNSLEQHSKLAAEIIQASVEKIFNLYIVPGLTDTEKLEIGLIQDLYRSVSFQSLGERKPRGISCGMILKIASLNNSNKSLLTVGSDLSPTQQQGEFKGRIPEHLIHELREFMGMTCANLVDWTMLQSSEKKLPQEVKFTLSSAPALPFKLPVMFTGDKTFEEFRTKHAKQVDSVANTLQTLFNAFVRMKIMPHLNISYPISTSASFSFMPSQAIIAASN